MSPAGPDGGLRQQKKQRTRRSLVDAALQLFGEHGYDGTTVADITAAAGISYSTFFSYFPSKDDLLFADTDERLDILSASFASRTPGERPIEALRRVVTEVLPDTIDELTGIHRDPRLQEVLARPALQARAQQRIASAEDHLATQLHAAFSDQVGELQAVAVTGALIAVALHGTRNGRSFDELEHALHWTLDLLEPVLEPSKDLPEPPPPSSGG